MLSFLRRPPDPKQEDKRTQIFGFVLIANLLIIGACLIVWKVNAISDVNIACAILIFAALAGLGVLFCMSCLLFCMVSKEDADRKLDIQTVYPTPEFTYFNGTMLNQLNEENGKDAFPGSVFSMLSTAPADSKAQSLETVSSNHSILWPKNKPPAALSANNTNNQSDYLRIY
ncbi:unnamed protein product [Bursaphelenchus okinawaensis]|uniref:Uncharacterized protein n=1 Tax=Bursaphelenchus okinawaensis TaxID=465554 RepID=A0A811L0L4_9BILA|nr:unnamed protein product [Bursaphelenchus okinawaensis]CAG9115264.1 unnamed protein product [Bursaphelenchus okinawaensis]